MKWSARGFTVVGALVLCFYIGAWLELRSTSLVAKAAETQPAADYAALLKDSKVSLSEGIKKGLAVAKEGIAYKVELEGDKTTHWAIDISKGERVMAVDIDVRTGKVVGIDLEDTDLSKLAKSAKVTMLEAIETVLKDYPGQVVSAELKLVGDKPEFTLKILTKDKVKSVKISGESGELLGKKASEEPAVEKSFTDFFPEEAGDFASTGRNKYFILEPGYFLILEDKKNGKDVRITINVLNETKKIDGVETRVVEDKVFEDGQLVEVVRDYFAFSKKTSSVYYFGEDVDVYKDGKLDNHNGSWHSGEKGAKYGLQMPGTPLLGARFYQEMAVGAGMDRIEIVSLTETLETPAGKFERCLKTEETSPLEPGVRDNKLHAPDIGVIQEGEAKLVNYGMAK
jgi:uncharacterized membrane protein YkoI